MVEELDIAHNTKIYALQLQTLHNSANPDIKQSNQNVILHVLWNVHIIDQNNHTWRGDYDIMLYRAIALQDNCDEPEQAAHSHAPQPWMILFSLSDWVISEQKAVVSDNTIYPSLNII